MIRIASAAVLIAIVIGTVWFLPVWATVALGALAAALGATELAAMSRQLGAAVSPMFLAAASAIVCVAFVRGTMPGVGAGDAVLTATLLAMLIAAGAMLLVAGPPDAFTIQRAGVTFMTPLYLGLPFGALAGVRASHGPEGFTALFVLLIVSDSAQYYCGRAFGRRKLSPLVSPAKTVEGAIGGLIATAIAGAFVGPAWIGVSAIVGAALALVLSAVGIVGDLFESLLKRGAGVKDSSALIPGHGGVLDRVDSYLFAAPVYFIFLRYLA